MKPLIKLKKRNPMYKCKNGYTYPVFDPKITGDCNTCSYNETCMFAVDRYE